MQDKRENEAELYRYLSALRCCVEQSRESRLIVEADEGAEQSDQIFRAIFENAADGILLVDLENKKFYMGNRVVCQMLGYSQQELRMLDVGDIHLEEDLPYVAEQFERQAREELTLARNIPVKRKDGSIFYADINSFPIMIGRKTYLMGIFRDITRRKDAEEELKRSEEKFRLAMEATNDALWDWNIMTDEVYRNPRHATMLGYTPHELSATQEEWEKRVYPDDRPLVFGLMNEVLEGKRDTIRVEYRLLKKSGDYIWVLGRGKVVAYNNDGSPARMIGTNVDISDRKRAEEKLKKSEEQFREIVEHTAVGVYRTTPGGRIIMANPALLRMLGYATFEELARRNLEKEGYEPQYSRSVFKEKIEKEGEVVGIESAWVKHNGTILTIIESARIVRDEDGNILYYEGTVEDITHRKEIETALAESEEKYRMLVESSTDAICIIDEDGTFLYTNKNTAELMGIQKEELVGKTLRDFFPKKDADIWIADVRQVIESKRDKSIVRQTEFEGQHFWYHTKLLPLGDGHGGTVVMAVSRDIGDIKRAEEQIRTLSTAVEQSIDGIAIGDLENMARYVNPAYAHMHGYDPDEMEGMHLLDVQNNQKMDNHKGIIRHLEIQKSWTGETEHIRKDGTVFPCYLSVTSLRDDQDQMTGRLAVCRDITESKTREKELATYREHMARAERLASLGTLSATIAHQVTQPLTVIRLSLDNVVDELERTSCSSRVLRRLRDSVAQVSNITSIINQFRNFARQSSDTSLGQVNVYSVALRVARLLEESAKKARITLHVEDMSELPPVLLHEREFEQILFALVENAIQAADGKKERRIDISGSSKAGQIELCFCDTCGGIPPENLERIFDPFFTTKPRGQGTGLGLCIVRDAMARVGGRIRVKSEFDKGSVFFVTLPVSEE